MRSSPSPNLRALFLVMLAFTAIRTCRGATMADEAKAAGKGMMVFAYGSDWSASGRAVHRVFQSDAFQNAVTSRYVTGTLDIRDQPTPESKATQTWAEPGDLTSHKLPALFLTAANGRGFSVLENIPITATADALIDRIRAAEAVRDDAEKLIAKAETQTGVEAAETIGEALALLEPQLGTVARLIGKKGYGEVFERLKTLDPQDLSGWQRRFTMGSGMSLIAEVNADRERKTFDRGEAAIAREAAKSDRHLTVNQRQAIAMLPFALYRTDKEREQANIRLLDSIAAMDDQTLWGMAAVGFLRRFKAPEAEKYLKPHPRRTVLRPRTPVTDAPPFAFRKRFNNDLQTLDGVTPAQLPDLTDAQRTALVRAHILASVGEKAFGRILANEGGSRFLDAFLADRDWMEAFAGSGPRHYGAASALTYLELMAWNEPGIYTNAFQRKAATAFSMNFPLTVSTNETTRTQERLAKEAANGIRPPVPNDEALVRTLQIFTELSHAGRLHDKVYGLDTYEWRYLLFPWDRNDPEELLAFNAFCNTSYEKTFRLGWQVPYRLRNCFGESVHNPLYYQPWIHEQSRYITSPEIGGVCNMISSFATTLGHAHGLMAVTAGQPGHCAFVVRPERGGPKQWQIHYYIQPYTQGRWGVFKWGGYQNLLAAEDLYEGTSLQDREYPRWLAGIRRIQAMAGTNTVYRPEVAELFKTAMEKVPGNWPAGRDWNQYLTAGKAPAEAWALYADTVLKTTFERIPIVTNLMEPYFNTLTAPEQKEALDAAIIRMLQAIRLTGRSFPEKPNYALVLNQLANRFGKSDPDRLFKLYGAALAAHPKTDDFFMQTLSWGARRYVGQTKWETPFLDLVTGTVASGAPGASKDKANAGTRAVWRKLIAKAEVDGVYDRFQRLVALTNRLYPPDPFPKEAKPFPLEDFGGVLISSNSLVQCAKNGLYDVPERHPEFSDATPLRGAKVAPPVSAARGPDGTWIQLRLGGISEVSGIVLVNARNPKQRKGQLPFTVELSEDGKSWKTLTTIEKDADSWRIPLTEKPERALFVRITRNDPVAEALFRFSKFLVYGRKLY